MDWFLFFLEHCNLLQLPEDWISPTGRGIEHVVQLLSDNGGEQNHRDTTYTFHYTVKLVSVT